MSAVTDLQQLVEQRLKIMGGQRGPMSARQAAARSNGQISYETLRLLRLGKHSGSITRDTAEGLALALDIPLPEVMQLIGQRIPQGPFRLPKKADTLTPAERAVVLSVVDAILDAAKGRIEQPPALRAVAKSPRLPGGSTNGADSAAGAAHGIRPGVRPAGVRKTRNT